MLVVTHAVREEAGRAWSRLIIDRLTERGVRLSFLVWDEGMVTPGAILPEDGPRREIETMNRWRPPQWLARAGARRPARLLRNARLRWWWRRLGRPDAILLLDPLRAEMRHYLPEGVRVGLLCTDRPVEPADDLALSTALAEQVVTTDTAMAPPADPAEEATAPRSAVPPLVVGLGPGDWRAAPDLFLRAAAALRARRPARFAWIGMDLDDGRSFPYRHDRARLGLDHDLTTTVDPEAALTHLREAAAVVVTARAPHPVTTHPWCDLVSPDQLLETLAVPVLALDTPGADGLVPDRAVRVPYPDVPALAEALDDALDGGGTNQLTDAIDRLLDALAGSGT